MAERGLRDQVVLATKAGFNRAKGNPNAGGNGAKNVRASLEQSLRRLGTEYVDLFWLHVWDTVTPAEEALQTLGDLVRAGKIRYFGVSNAPAWYVTRMVTLAAAHGVPGPVAMQLHYSLVDRDIEREHVPMARELGLAVQPWAPLAAGFLTGKYERATVEGRTDGPRWHALPDAAGAESAEGSDGRLNGANPFGDSLFTPRNWDILEVLRRVAAEGGHSMAQVALRWAVGQSGICAPVVGASRPAQMDENVAALGIELSAAQVAALDDASSPLPSYPYVIFSRGMNRMVFGGADVAGWTPPVA